MPLFQATQKKLEKEITPPAMAVEITDVVRRLRMQEERQENLRNKMQLIEQNMISIQKKFLAETKTITIELTELNAKIRDIEEKMSIIIKEVKLSAKKEEVDVIKKYLDYWSPVQFATADKVESIVKDILEEKGL